MSLEAIHKNAQLVLDHCRDISGLGSRFGYNAESVKWLDGFIERMRTSTNFTGEKDLFYVHVLGSYLGECVIHVYGGSWREHEGSWAFSSTT